MRIKHRYVFRSDNDNCGVKEFLNLNSIKYKISSGIELISVEVFEDKNYWEELDRLMTNIRAVSQIERVFSKSELQNADWLTIRGNWRLGYPQPDDGFAYRETTYNNRNFCSKCGCGLEQKEEFHMIKQINWGNKNFLMLYWIEDELFVSNKVTEDFERHNISGITLMPVKKSKSDEEFSNIKQMKVNCILKKGLILDESEIKERTVCENCHEEKFVLKDNMELSFKKDLFENCPDIIKTYERFGTGLIAARKIIISRKVASIIIRNGWEKNVILEPIELI
jgi:hypothetical protein